jgi:hypothetical protein
MIESADELRVLLAPMQPDERDMTVLLALLPAIAGIDAVLAAADLGDAP